MAQITLNSSGVASSGALVLQSNGTTTAVTVDASQNVGVGVTPSAWSNGKAIEVVAKGNALWSYGSADTRLTCNMYYNGAFLYGTTNPAGQYAINGNIHSWSIAASGTAGNTISFTQAMTLDASGKFLIGKTTTSTANQGIVFNSNANCIFTVTDTGAGDTLNVWNDTAGAYRFYVTRGGTIFATSTTISAISDIRLKENIQDLDVGLDKIMALKPRKFDWKDGKGKNIKGDRGWIAQEFEQVFPDMVSTWKDEQPEGEEPYKSVGADLIPVLVKSIQELNAKVEAQAVEIAALKGTA